MFNLLLIEVYIPDNLWLSHKNGQYPKCLVFSLQKIYGSVTYIPAIDSNCFAKCGLNGDFIPTVHPYSNSGERVYVLYLFPLCGKNYSMNLSAGNGRLNVNP